MREIIEKRRPHCKVFDLGGRRRKLIASVAPLHYVRDGKIEDIDTTPFRGDRHFEVTKAPYRLKIDPERPAYLYTNENGRQVEVELIEVGGAPIQAAQGIQEDAGVIRWVNIAPQTDVMFKPLRKGIEALVVLYGPEAPRQWKWRVRGEKELLLSPKGHDARQQVLELSHQWDGDELTIEWAGRATSRQKLRQKQGFSEDIFWPVVIDPTINESIVNGADDVYTYYRPGFIDIFNSTRATVFAGSSGSARDYAGFRFRSLGVPQGAMIQSASLSVDVTLAFQAVPVSVYGDDVGDAAAWSVSNRVRNITRTTAVANVTLSATGIYPIPVTGIVQEIVARSDWASGNAMRFGMFPDGAGPPVGIAALEHATRTEAQLEIEYEEAAAARVAPKMMHYRRLRI